MENGSTALITGASSGLGATFARQLAARGYNLILVARRRERLASLAAELTSRHNIQTDILVADLTSQADLETVESCLGQHPALDMLVNNAGFGAAGKFARVDLEHQLAMVQVHIVATMRLCRAVLPGMVARRRGAIINLSSLSAFVPLPGSATYSGTKAFLINFSEALQTELAGSGVKVQALCPGFTHTEFHDTPDLKNIKRSQIPSYLWGSAEDVVAASLKALERGPVTYIPGFKNQLLAIIVNRFTRPLALKILKRKIE